MGFFGTIRNIGSRIIGGIGRIAGGGSRLIGNFIDKGNELISRLPAPIQNIAGNIGNNLNLANTFDSARNLLNGVSVNAGGILQGNNPQAAANATKPFLSNLIGNIGETVRGAQGIYNTARNFFQR